jgi:carbonic anhydrase
MTDTAPRPRRAMPMLRSRLTRTACLGLLVLAPLAAGQAEQAPAPATPTGIDAAVLGCMDFRLVDEAERYFTERGLRDRYDQLVLAGAALGAVTDRFPAWNTTFWEHLEVAIQLHQIRKVILLDHRDCGAYRVILGEDFAKDPAKETAVHTETMRKLSQQILERYPQLTVERLLMGLDGKVEVIE